MQRVQCLPWKGQQHLFSAIRCRMPQGLGAGSQSWVKCWHCPAFRKFINYWMNQMSKQLNPIPSCSSHGQCYKVVLDHRRETFLLRLEENEDCGRGVRVVVCNLHSNGDKEEWEDHSGGLVFSGVSQTCVKGRHFWGKGGEKWGIRSSVQRHNGTES